MKACFAIAPNFQCKGSWMDRLLVVEGDGWRAPHDDELAVLTSKKPAEDDPACSVFVLHSCAYAHPVLDDAERRSSRGHRRLCQIFR